MKLSHTTLLMIILKISLLADEPQKDINKIEINKRKGRGSNYHA